MNQGPFPPPALPGFSGNTGLSVTPGRPTCPSRAPSWSSLLHALGLPVLPTLSLRACCRRYPGAATGAVASLFPSSRISLPRKGDRVALRIDLFEACSAFTRVTARTLAGPPYVARCVGGVSRFVTSMTAPTTSGWSIRRAGFAPTAKRHLSTAHTLSSPSTFRDADIRGRSSGRSTSGLGASSKGGEPVVAGYRPLVGRNRRTIRTKTITLRTCHNSAQAAPRDQANCDRILPSRRGHYCPRPSQSRASAIHAPGSSPYSVAHEAA